MYQMLLGGRFEYLFAGGEEAAYVLRNHPEYRERLSLVRVADAPPGNKRYIMFSRAVDPDQMARINAVIAGVRHSRPYREALQAAGL
jgi:hypothetical protein